MFDRTLFDPDYLRGVLTSPYFLVSTAFQRWMQEVIHDDPHAPAFQRKRDRVWVRRAQKLLRQIR